MKHTLPYSSLLLLFLVVRTGFTQSQGGGEKNAIQTALADSSCDFVRSKSHPNPKRLVQEYLKRDGEGQFLGSSKWFDGAALCPGHEPGPDIAHVITGYEIKGQRIAPDRAEFVVLYQIAGDMKQNAKQFVFDPKPSQGERKFIAWKTAYGWRLQGSLLGDSQFVMPLPILNFCKDRLKAQDRATLEDLGKRVRVSEK